MTVLNGTPGVSANSMWGSKAAVLLASLWFLVAAPPVAGQTAPSAMHPYQGVRIHIGMWSTHVFDISRGLANNWLVGVSWRGFYGGTFVNSFGNRSFAGGIYRTVIHGEDGPVVPALGYRVGVVTGYDERFMPLAGKMPALPMVQVVGDLEMGRMGLELAWAGLVASMAPKMRF